MADSGIPNFLGETGSVFFEKEVLIFLVLREGNLTFSLTINIFSTDCFDILDFKTLVVIVSVFQDKSTD